MAPAKQVTSKKSFLTVQKTKMCDHLDSRDMHAKSLTLTKQKTIIKAFFKKLVWTNFH